MSQKVIGLWCVTCDMYTMQERVGKSRNGVSKYKCMSCQTIRYSVTPS